MTLSVSGKGLSVVSSNLHKNLWSGIKSHFSDKNADTLRYEEPLWLRVT